MKNKEKDITVKELVGIMLGAFDSNQKYMDTKFDVIDKRFETITGVMNKNFKEVKEQINNINKNIVDVVRLEDFNKLEVRVEKIENNA